MIRTEKRWIPSQIQETGNEYWTFADKYCGCKSCHIISWNHAPNLWFVFTSLKWVRDYRKLARCGNLRNYIFSVSLWHTLVVQSDTEVFKLVRMVSTGPSSQHASPKTCDSGCFSFLKRFGSRIGPLGRGCYALSRLFPKNPLLVPSEPLILNMAWF